MWGNAGMTQVAYRTPGSDTADWVDIYNRLYRERIIFLGQEIDDELANQIIGVMLVSTTTIVERRIVSSASDGSGGDSVGGLFLFTLVDSRKVLPYVRRVPVVRVS